MTHIHLIGIAGTGLSAIARFLLERGEKVSGSDRQISPLAESLQAAGAQVFAGHRAENIQGADIVVRSSAVPEDNVEVQAALEAGIPVYKREDFLGKLMSDRMGIAVAGTHGKTTTTAMIAWILSALEQDPSYIIGGVASNLGSNAHAGQGPAFVIEADEYDHMFWGLRPDLAVVTNVEHDHPDFYPTPESFFAAFEEFIRRVDPQGAVLACGDDPGAASILEFARSRGLSTFSYGLDSSAYDYYGAGLRRNENGGFTFDLVIGQAHPPIQVDLKVPGAHNVNNGLAALGVAHRLGLNLEGAVLALGEFQGTGRRFEVRGEAAGVTVIDDYAHHPTEIRATLAAARARYGDRRIWAVWQPHTFSRASTLKADFIEAISRADRVVVTEIYAAREVKPLNGLSGQLLAAELEETAPHLAPFFAENNESATQYLLSELSPGDVLLILSAGDAAAISSQVLEALDYGKRPPRREWAAGLEHLASPEVERRLEQAFGSRLQRNAPLARFTAARAGGPADFLVEAGSVEELFQATSLFWELDLPFYVLGGGSNVLVSDRGVRGIVLLNRARKVRFEQDSVPPEVWAESGANFGVIARQAAKYGLSGLEWAAGIPGTVGGAVFGNAGAHAGDVAGNLIVATILHRKAAEPPAEEIWPVERFEFAYRSSLLKRTAHRYAPENVVLSARLRLENSEPQVVQARMDEFKIFRRRTQPPGASMGSMFKNPPGDYAGRLIEAAGLKGARIGGAEISSLHANFFINHGQATATDIYRLIQLARTTVAEKFGIEMDLEIELMGDWDLEPASPGVGPEDR